METAKQRRLDGDTEKALTDLREAVAKGNGLAALTVGEWLDPSRGAVAGADPVCAIAWYKRAGSLGVPSTTSLSQMRGWAAREAQRGNQSAIETLNQLP